MHIEYMYKYIDQNGNTIVSGHVPQDITPIETMDILTAEEGYVLAKGDEIVGSTVWLHDGDIINNYVEVHARIDEYSTNQEI